MNRIVRRLQAVWRGPAVGVRAGKLAFTLGSGQPRTQLAFSSLGQLSRVVRDPEAAFGEAYMRGEMVVEGDLLDVLAGYLKTLPHMRFPGRGLLSRALRLLPSGNGRAKAIENARRHYDVGNEFFSLWLDPALVYSCAYFQSPDDTLEQAQLQKLELLCRKLRLQPGQTLLDIGCGWGGLLYHAAEHYDARATGITPSAQQVEYVREQVARRGLVDRVSVIQGDWRQLSGTFDRVVSVGMFEHVGDASYPRFMQYWRRLLARDGISILHTIGHMTKGERSPWIERYIFPGGYLPTLTELAECVSGAGLLVADVENLWRHYALTLSRWSANLTAARPLVDERFGAQFARMWELYLKSSEASFRWGGLSLWQMVILPDKLDSWPLDREVGVRTGSKRLQVEGVGQGFADGGAEC